MRCNLWTNPKVRLMARDTGHKVASIIGGLHWFWSQVHEHGEGERVAGLSAQDVDNSTKLHGFASALSKVGWAHFDDTSASAPRFSENSAALAKERERVYNATRKKKWRSKVLKSGFVSDSPGDSPEVSPTPIAELSKAEQSEAKRKPPNRPWEDLFRSEWAQAHGGGEYRWNGAKDGAAMGRIRKHFGDDLEKFRPVLRRYVTSTDPFAVKVGHSCAELDRNLNAYAAIHQPTLASTSPKGAW